LEAFQELMWIKTNISSLYLAEMGVYKISDRWESYKCKRMFALYILFALERSGHPKSLFVGWDHTKAQLFI